MAAQAARAEHHEVVVSPGEFFGAVPHLVWHEDEPIAFPSSVPLYFVSRLAREHVKVVLTGEGADELFLGYNRYRVAAWNERLGQAYWGVVPGALRRRARGLLGRLPATLERHAGRTFLARVGLSFGAASFLIAASLGLGMTGYRYFEGLDWIDAFADSAMLLSGVGPLRPPVTPGGKLFAGFFALYSGLAAILATSILLAPLLHRLLHVFHLEEERREA